MRFLIIVLAGVLVCTSSTTAQQIEIRQLELHPAVVLVPALQYQLLPPMIDRTQGNAVVYYGKVPAEQTAFFSSKEIWDQVRLAPEMTLDEVAANAVLRNATRNSSIINFLRLGARCQTADWQIPFRDQPFFSILLPDVQQMRSYARLLAVRARIQIADKQFDEAIDTLQIGFALSEHLCQAPVVVSGLVGAAIANMMLGVVEEMIQQPAAPNLYWALTSLPDPLINLRLGIDVEQFSLYFTEPSWRNVETLDGDTAFWNKELRRLWQTIQQLDYASNKNMELAYLVMRGYPGAKQRLILGGITIEKVDAMPVAQVIMIDALRQYQIHRDELSKWSYLPLHECRPQLKAASQAINEAFDSGREALPVSAHLAPSLESVMAASVGVTRNVAALRIAEALRLHASTNGGTLPKTLADVTLVPIPNDPGTGQPFTYRLENDTAELQCPQIQYVTTTWQLKLAY